ncbi:MAG: acyl-CoA dehydrogenase family protein [Betaproteobacteria bacterium]|nr:acyl-CoA dehydrogenase family protein [Betaproteobacteria bacterium]
MDLNFSPEEIAFREDVRRFVEQQLPPGIRDKVMNGVHLNRDEHVLWQRILHERGWGGVGWPAEFGGPGWTPTEQYIFEEECAKGGAPRLISFGLKMIAPVLMAFGTPQQQARFLPKIMCAEEWWCQGYSEPGAGSDLASVKTRAVREGDHYVVNGQKTWTTLGQYADWIFCLVRTDPEAKKQSGISFLLIDMKSPGVTVRPIITLDGAHEVNEVWLEDVKVPVENRIGEENKGWTYAKFLLGHERTNIAGIGIAKRELARLKRIAEAEGRLADALFAARVAQVEIDLTALEITNLGVLSAERANKAPGPEASILKIKGTEIQQAIAELMMQAVGAYALPFKQADVGPAYAANLGAGYCNLRKLSIFGGSNEIQKNIISQMIMGL